MSSKDKKKLTVLIPTLKGGGTERVASEFSNFISDANLMKVSIVMYGNNIGTNYKLSKNIQLHTIENKFNGHKRLISAVKSMWFIRNTVNKINPDYVFSFGEYWNNFVMLSLLGTNHNIYLSDRCQPDKSLGLVHDFLRKILYPRSKGFIVQTNYAKKYFTQKKLHKNIEVIPNPVKLPTKLRPESERRNTILSVGRLIDSKNFDLLIRIFSELNLHNWKLVIVGDNENNRSKIVELGKIAQELGCEKNVELVGHKTNLSDYYSEAKIFAFTSSSEGFPNVIIEAMAYGLTVVAFDCSSGPSDIIKNGKNGFLIPLFDIEKFKTALRKLIEDEFFREELCKTAIETSKEFSSAIISKRLINFLSKKQ